MAAEDPDPPSVVPTSIRSCRVANYFPLPAGLSGRLAVSSSCPLVSVIPSSLQGGRPHWDWYWTGLDETHAPPRGTIVKLASVA